MLAAASVFFLTKPLKFANGCRILFADTSQPNLNRPCAGVCAGDAFRVNRESVPSRDHLAPQVGLEPTQPAPEAGTLSKLSYRGKTTDYTDYL